MKNPGRWLRFLSAGVLVCVLASSVSAADIETRIEQTELSPGESTTLSIRVTGSHSIEEGAPPRAQGLSIEHRGNVSSFEYTNGKSWSGTVVQYEVTPQKEGRFVIPPITIKVDGSAVSSKPVTISVSGAAVSRRPGGFPGFPRFPRFPGFPDPDEQREQQPRRISGEVELSSRSVYAGEAVVVRYNVVSNGALSLKGFQSLPETNGFVRKDIDSQADEAGVGSGRKRLMSFFVVPQATGSLSLGGGTAVLVDDDAWGPFSNVPVDFPVVSMDVRPLPKEGRPADFSGCIGSFTLKVDTESLSCAALDERKVTATVSGTGNFYSITAPVFKDLPADITCVSSSSTEAVSAVREGVRGEKVFTLSVIPGKEGSFDLGKLTFCYFDPSAGQYRTAAAGPIKLTVSGVSQRTEVSAAADRGSSVWLWIILALVLVAGVCAGIVIYEKRKYGEAPAQTGEKSSSDTVEPGKALTEKPELSRLRYDLALAKDRVDSRGFLSAAEKILAAYEKSSSDTGKSGEIRRELYPYRYGGQTLSSELMADFEWRLLSLAGG
jgi:hypothetical protein